MRALRLLVCLAASLLAGHALAQSARKYPDQTVHMIIPFPAGGPADILGRFVGQRLSEIWNQPVVIENKPGANTAIAAARVARSPADGYTLFVVMDVTMVLNPLTTQNLSYDPEKDFELISMMAKNTSLLTVRADIGAKNVQELIARGKANPGKMNFGAGIITTRLAAELFNRETGITAQFVPFQGSPPTVQALLSGSVDYIVDGAAASLPLIQAGQLRAIAKTNDGPVAGLPDLKSMAAEVGSKSLEDVSAWIALVAPAGTPRAIVTQINDEVRKMLADPAMVQKLRAAGITPASSTPEEFRAFVDKERIRWTKVVKDSGIQFNQ